MCSVVSTRNCNTNCLQTCIINKAIQEDTPLGTTNKYPKDLNRSVRDVSLHKFQIPVPYICIFILRYATV